MRFTFKLLKVYGRTKKVGTPRGTYSATVADRRLIVTVRSVFVCSMLRHLRTQSPLLDPTVTSAIRPVMLKLEVHGRQ